ncbi:MAG: anti-sigma factor [Sphingomicrobium sp.]
MTPADRDLAALWALGLAEGRDLARAARLNREDSDFRAEVDGWIARLAPLLDEVDEVAPPPSLWRRIEDGLGASAGANDNAPLLQRELRLWRGVTAMMTALAACFALLLLFRPVEQVPIAVPPSASDRPTAPPLVAMVGEDQKEMMIVANWDPVQRRLVLAVAGNMPADVGKSHEIWIIPRDGTPHSLGTMPEGKKMHMDLASQIAELLHQGSTIAISLEPPGGSPTGAPTGPVMWSGKLETA